MFEQRPAPLVLPVQPMRPKSPGTFFGFTGMPATITVQKADGTYVDGQKVEPKEPENGNDNVQAA